MNLLNRFSSHPWTKTSQSFYDIIKCNLPKGERILEVGSATGHISYRLAREGYDITLLDIRPEAISEARKVFGKTKASFLVGDLFSLDQSWDSIWNSGCIQCYSPEQQKKIVDALSIHCKRLLLFYPDTNDPRKKRGTNPNSPPGVADSVEYDVSLVPNFFHERYFQVMFGVIAPDKTAADFDFLWILGQNLR